MTPNFWLAQVIGAIWTICVVVGIQLKKKQSILIAWIIAGALITLQYFVLGNKLSTIVCTIGLVQTILVACLEKSKPKLTIVSVFALATISLIINIPGVKTPIDLLPIISVIIYPLSIVVKQESVLRALTLVNTLCWLIFGLAIGAYASSLGSAFSAISNIIAIIKYDFSFYRKKTADMLE